MCDYSLMEFPNRLAVDGEVLVVHRFRSGSLGLACPMDCNPVTPGGRRSFWKVLKDVLFLPEPPRAPAVCIPPGASLILHDVPARLRRELQLAAEEPVKFVQLSATENQHRDAIRFRTGHTLRLQELTVGQRVEVIDLGNSSVEEPDTHDNSERMPAFSGRGGRS